MRKEVAKKPNTKTRAAMRDAENGKVERFPDVQSLMANLTGDADDIDLHVSIPAKLVRDIKPVLAARGLSLDEVVRLYLRSMVTSVARSKALALTSQFPFGKYQGELVEVVARAEPGYIQWLVANSNSVKFEPEVLLVVEQAVLAAERAA